VAIDVGTCRSGRTGSAPRRETVGNASGAEEGQRRWGGKPCALGGEAGIRRDTYGAVMGKAPPAAALEMVQAECVLRLLILALDPPAPLGEADQIGEGCGLRQSREPILGRFGFPARPLDEQPLRRAGRRPLRITMGRPDPHARKARTHGPSGALAPGHQGREQALLRNSPVKRTSRSGRGFESDPETPTFECLDGAPPDALRMARVGR